MKDSDIGAKKITIEDFGDAQEVNFLKKSTLKRVLFHICGILSLGAVYLIFYWYSLYYMLYDYAINFDEADTIFIKTMDGVIILVPVQNDQLVIDPFEPEKKTEMRFIHFIERKYTYDWEHKHFYPVETIFGNRFQMSKGLLLRDCYFTGLDKSKIKDIKLTFSENKLAFPEPSIFEMILTQMLHPIIVGLTLVAILCLLCMKVMQFITLMFFVVFIITFQVVEYKTRTKKIKEMSELNETVKVLRKSTTNTNTVEMNPGTGESSKILSDSKKDSKINNSSTFINKFIKIPSEDVLPGDLIFIESDTKITCDLLMIEGSCLVNEAMLTGESIPITKTAIKNNQELTSLNVLYAGSDCLMQRDKVCLGMVVNTGWNTFKGKIVSSLVYSKTGDSIIIHQVIYLMSWLVLICAVFLAIMIGNDYYKGRLFLFRTLRYSTDLLTKGTQPTTIFMLFISVHFVSSKLMKREIISVKSNKLYKAGRVDTLCFDKTGTLTKNDLLISGMSLPKNENEFSTTYNHIKFMKNNKHLRDVLAISCCCHDLHIINNKLIGDPVDIEIFKYSKGNFEIVKIEEGIKVGEYENPLKLINVVHPPQIIKKSLSLSENFSFIILRIFPFLAEKKRMGTLVYESDINLFPASKSNKKYVNESIILEDPTGENNDRSSQFDMEESQRSIPNKEMKYVYVCKGAPEILKDMCLPETIPSNFKETLNEFAQQGMRVIAMAVKRTNDPNLEQEEYEQDMEFKGFTLLSNPVKKETPYTIEELKYNNIFCAMITGDHLYTGVNIGYASQIININESVWMGLFDESSQKPIWKFMTYQDLLKGVDSNPETTSQIYLQENSLTVSQHNTNQIKESKFSISKREAISSKNITLDKYKAIVSKRKKTSIDNLIEESKSNNFCIAMDGKCVSYFMNSKDLDESHVKFLLKKSKIYGRCNPDQKRIVIERFKEIKEPHKKCVGFVGDGANDCKALNRADIGLSIGNSESSMASPFITSSDEISKIKDLLELGKFTISNFFDIYYQLNTMNLYETMSILLIVSLGYSYYNWKYIVDFFFFAPMAILACTTDSIGYLTPVLPDGELFTQRFFTYFSSLIPLAVIIQIFIYGILTKSLYYKSSEEIHHDVNINMEDHFCVDHALIVLSTTFIAVFEAIANQSTYPFKKSPFTNPMLIGLASFLLIFVILCSYPQIFSTNESFLIFFLRYTKNFEYPPWGFERFLIFSVVIGFFFYFYVSYNKYHFLNKVNYYLYKLINS